MDETFWPLVAKQQQLVRLHNNEEFKPSTNIDIKQGITLVVTVAANGEKLPLYVSTCHASTSKRSQSFY